MLNKSFIQLLAHCRRGDRKNVGAGNREKSREVPPSTHSTASVIMNLEQPQLFALVLRNGHWWMLTGPHTLLLNYRLSVGWGMGRRTTFFSYRPSGEPARLQWIVEIPRPHRRP